MIPFIVFLIFLSGTYCDKDFLMVQSVTPEKNKPITLSPNTASQMYINSINGTLTPESLSHLRVTTLDFILTNASQLEPGAACSPPALKLLGVHMGSTPITVTKDMLKNCEKLKELNVGGIYYRHHPLAVDALTNLPKLKRLIFTYMNLQHVTKEYFRNLPLLETLTLRNCLIEEIHKDAFSGLTNLKDIQFVTKHFPRSLNIISEIPVKVDSFTFDGLNGTLTKSKLDVREFHLHALQLDGIEAGAACPTSSVKKLTLDIKTPNLIKFTKETLRNCENLKELRIKADSCKHSEIEEDTFQNLSNLKNLSLENLELGHVTKNTFKNSLLLENLKLCNVVEIEKDAFNHLYHLKTVFLCLQLDGHNPENTQKILNNTIKTGSLSITGLRGKLFLPQFKEVEDLSLDFTDLEGIESGVCSSPTLKKFTLRFNPRENFTLNKDAFNCENLEELSLHSSEYTDLPLDAFQNLPHLKVLDLHWLEFNPLKREYFKNLQSLEKLILHECATTEFQTDAFYDLVNLKVLQVTVGQRVMQKNFPEKLFTKNVKLEKLCLANSDITDLNWDEFKELQHLTTLDLSMNRIRSFDAEKIAQNIPSLRNFHIDMTSLSGEEYTRFKEELKKKLNVTFLRDRDFPV